MLRTNTLAALQSRAVGGHEAYRVNNRCTIEQTDRVHLKNRLVNEEKNRKFVANETVHKRNKIWLYTM